MVLVLMVSMLLAWNFQKKLFKLRDAVWGEEARDLGLWGLSVQIRLWPTYTQFPIKWEEYSLHKSVSQPLRSTRNLARGSTINSSPLLSSLWCSWCSCCRTDLLPTAILKKEAVRNWLAVQRLELRASSILGRRTKIPQGMLPKPPPPQKVAVQTNKH